MPTPSLRRSVAIAASLGAIALGVAVLVGWRFGVAEFTRLLSHAQPLPPDSALAFIFVGFGTLGLALGRRHWTLAGGLLTLLLAVESTAEQFIELSSDFDGLLVEVVLGAEAARHTGMPGFAAGLFLISGTSLLGSLWRRPALAGPMVTAIPGVVLLALSAVVQAAFLANFSGAIWHEVAHRAFVPSYGHALIGTALLLHGWSRSAGIRHRMPHWSAWLAGAFVALLAVAVWQTLHQRERLNVDRVLQIELSALKEAFIERVVSRIAPVMRIKSTWERGSGIPAQAWTPMALGAMQEHAGFTAMLWVEDSYRLQRVTPRTTGAKLPPVGVPLAGLSAAKLDQGRADGALVLSDALTLTGQGMEFLLLTPLHVENRFQGFVGAAFDFEKLFAGLVENLAAKGIAIGFRFGDYQAIEMSSGESKHSEQPLALSIPLFGQMLTIEVSHLEPPSGSDFILPEIMLALGMLLAVLAIVVVNGALRTREMLSESARLYRETFDNAPIAMSWIANGERFIRVNRAYRDMMGYSDAELQNMGPRDLLHPSEKESSVLNIRRMLDGAIDRVEREVKYAHKDGHLIWAHISSVVMPGPDGERLLLTHLQDITARKLAEEQLFQSQKMEALGNLAGGIAHDFNNMLLPIIALSELSQKQLPKDSPVRENLESVLQAANQAAELVQQVLTFSRQNERQPKEVDISQCTSDAIKLLRNIIPSSISIVGTVEDDVGIVVADVAQLQSIFMNLGTNAFDAMDGKVGQLTVSLLRAMATPELTARQPILVAGRPYAKISVADTGHGMDRATVEKIFNPFFTTKPVGEGTGLGLAMVHGIVNGLDGAIDVRSELGHGTTFDIYLPLAQSAAVSPSKPSTGTPSHLAA